MVWYSHLSKNFPQFVVIHTVKGFGIVNKAEIDVFLELSCFFHDLYVFITPISKNLDIWCLWKCLSISCLVVSVCDPMDCSLPGSLSMEFFRQEYWSGLPFPSPRDLPDPGVKPSLLHCRQILYHLNPRKAHLVSTTHLMPLRTISSL